MLKKIPFLILLLYFPLAAFAQHKVEINAMLNSKTNIITIEQQVIYHNQSKKALQKILFMDWANAFSNKETPLAVRFNEDYRRAFHFSWENERGATQISKVVASGEEATFSRPLAHPDVLEVALAAPLAPNAKIELRFTYQVKIADDRFTDYGYARNGFKLRYWHLAPAIYHEDWLIYSHKNLNDFNAAYANYSVNLSIDEKFVVQSNLSQEPTAYSNDKTKLHLQGDYVTNVNLFISEEKKFRTTSIDSLQFITDVPMEGLSISKTDSLLQKVYDFSKEYLGKPKQESVLLDYTDYKKQPVYGFTQLPKFLRPFEKSFQYELISLKLLTRALAKQNFKTDLRKEQWITDALQVYVMIKYVEHYYPEEKMAGRLHKVFGLRWFHGTQIPFNEQYYIGAKNMPARFLEQPLNKPKDSLLKFNYNISNPYKAGMGLHYLESYFEEDKLLQNNLKQLTAQYQNQFVEKKVFLDALFKNVDKPTDWFRYDYLGNPKKLDIAITGIKRKKDSLIVKLKNKGRPVPVKISGYNKDQLVSEQWTPVITDSLKIAYPKSQFDRFIIDEEERLPDLNRGNNYYKSPGLLNKKIQFRLLQDVQDPKYHQVFVIPEVDFNVYDGLLISSTFFNKPLIRKNLLFGFAPTYGFKSQELLGSANISYAHQLKDYGWYLLTSSMSYQTFSYAEDLKFQRIRPSLLLSYRPKDLRSNLVQSISTRYFSIQRERSPLVELNTPDYNVFTTNYSYLDSNLTKVLAFGAEFQQAQNFNKIEGTFHYRKLFLNNQQVNLRLYAGTFINNKTTENDGDFFSFGLDRPTDYLFQYPYISRDDESGIWSQQYITAEGNFKSRLNTRFANEWMTTASLESSIWNWIYVYGDTGFVKNKGTSAEWLYDSGIKFNLVQDYFEVFFPMYSSIGFEPNLPDYGQRIRFKITLSITTLTKLFTREWY